VKSRAGSLGAVIVFALAAVGCGGPNDVAGAGGGTAAPLDDALPEAEIPTEEEAAADAAAEVTAENADEVFEELSREIEEEGGG
jgi:hypothetical protein